MASPQRTDRVPAAAGTAEHRAAVPHGPVARLRAARAPLISGAVAAAACAALVVRDPHTSGSWGFCPLSALIGVYCPLCGGLRATHDLMVGDLAGAWAMNPLWLLMIPVTVVVGARWTLLAARGRSAALGLANHWYVLGGVLLVLYWVARNIPAWPALAPHLV